MKKLLGVLAITLALAGYLAWTDSDSFLSEYNLKNQARLAAFISILAIGEALVIITGGIDLSIGSVVCLSAALVTWFIGERHWSPALAVLAVMGMMGGVGVAQGQLVTRVGLQPFVATLGGLMILRGLAQVLTNGGAVSVGADHETFELLGKGFIFGSVPIPAAIMLAVAALFAFLMHFTVYGRHLYALGCNEEAARFSGVNVARLKNSVYVVSALLAALTGTLYAGYLSSVQPSTLGNAFELYAIAAAVLGGCSLRGGEGSVIGVIIGAVLMRLIGNSMILLQIPSFWEQAVTGGVILAAALLDVLVYRGGAARKA